MIVWKDVLAKRKVAQTPFSLTIGPGLSALVAPTTSRAGDLLRIAAGAERPKAGAVRVDGKEPRRMAASIGYVPMHVTFPPGVRVGEYLRLSAKCRGVRGDIPIAQLRALGNVAAEEQELGSLSPHVAKAVAIAEALSAGFAFLEEPFIELDARSHEPLRGILREASTQKKTILFLTASLREAALADAIHLVRPDGVHNTPTFDSFLFDEGGEYRFDIATSEESKLAQRIAVDVPACVLDLRMKGHVQVATRDPNAFLERIALIASADDIEISSLELLPRRGVA